MQKMESKSISIPSPVQHNLSSKKRRVRASTDKRTAISAAFDSLNETNAVLGIPTPLLQTWKPPNIITINEKKKDPSTMT